MNLNPTVSVLIPVFNSATFLDETLQSVLNQTYGDYELIIVDDCSTDSSHEVIQKHLADPRIRYYRNEYNLGLVGNFNECLSHAKGKYIKFLLADDKFHPRLLEKFVPIMERYPNVSLVTSYRKEFGLEHTVSNPPFTHLQSGKRVTEESLKTHNWIGEPTVVMFRRENIERVGTFNSEFLWLVDWDMWLRQLTVGDCYIVPEVLSYFRVHKKQVSASVKKAMTNYTEFYHFYKSMKEQNKYRLELLDFKVDDYIQFRAASCLKAVIKLLPRLGNGEGRMLFKQAIAIVSKEQLSLRSVYDAFTKKIPLATSIFFYHLSADCSYMT